MEKRLILAAVLSLLVIILYQFLMMKEAPKRVSAPKERVEATKKKETPPVKEIQPQDLSAQLFKVKKGEEVEARVDSPLYTAVISSSGGGLKSLRLKRYKVSMDKDSDNIEMVTTSDRGLYPLQIMEGDGTPVELIPARRNITIADGEEKELLLRGRTGDGIEIEERLRFGGNTYGIGILLTVKNPSDNPYSGIITLNLFKSLKVADRGRRVHIGPVLYKDGKVVSVKVKKLTSLKDYKDILWAGVEDKYFLFALIPPEKASSVVGKIDEEAVFSSIKYPLSIRGGGSKEIALRAYAGPKEVDILEGFEAHLEDTVNFGVFSVIAKPLLTAMKFFYRYTGNYGIAIIILTVIIKILFYPLSLKSLRSMKEMQKIQPQIALLKERYKDDKERMNKELMELYKRSKVNPLGGCLPMILQIPVFIALYDVLLLAIELRHAPFFLWIKDLSAKDPYYVTPIIMGITMFVQQRMSPTAMDPQQAKMMLIMPIVFTFLFLNFPSGLVIYWLVNNILSIAQQYYIQKNI